MNITCSCGHSADYFEFASSTPNVFNCPKCHTMWRRVLVPRPEPYQHWQPQVVIEVLHQLTLFGGNNAIL